MTAKSLKHKFQSAVADAGTAGEISPNDWNDDHDLRLGGRTVTITTDTIVTGDELSLVKYNNATGVAVALAAPGGANFPSGWTTFLRNAGAGAVTITVTGATVNGGSTLIINSGNGVILFSDGSNYDAIISVSTAAGGSGGAAEYVFSTNTSAPPSSGQIRLNNATQSSATIIWVHNVTNGGVDLKRALETTPIGAKLIIQDQNDSSKYANYQVAGTLVDGGTYWEIPITFLVGGSALANQQRAMLSIQTGASYAPLASPAFTGNPTAPTPPPGDSDTSIATTAWVAAAVAAVGGAPQGRLTLQTATPVMTTTQPAKTTIYYTPYVGNMVPIYNGTSMVMTTFAELSVATTDTTKSPAAIGASKCNDWFVWSDAGTLRIGHGPDWTNDTIRSAGTALVMVNGILLNNAAITNGPAAQRGTFVGTTRSNASSQLDWIFGGLAAGGTAGFFGVANAYNQVDVRTLVADSTDSWTYGTAAWRASNAAGTGSGLNMRASYIDPLGTQSIAARNYAFSSSSAGFASNGIGIDTLTAQSGLIGISGATIGQPAVAEYGGVPGLGFHFVQAIEYTGAGTATFRGDNGTPAYCQTGLVVHFQA